MSPENNKAEVTTSQKLNSHPTTVPNVNQINLDQFSLSDPTDRAGAHLSAFSFYRLDELDLPSEQAALIIDKLYDRVFRQMKDLESNPGIQIKISDFTDYANRKDVRRYITANRKTNRKAGATMFIRFLRFNNQIYLSVDSYVLGKINWLLLFLRVCIQSVARLFGCATKAP